MKEVRIRLQQIADLKIERTRKASSEFAVKRLDEAVALAKEAITALDNRARHEAIKDLCYEYDRESNPEERENILRTLFQILKNEPVLEA